MTLTSAEGVAGRVVLVDTSAAVPLLVADHAHHESVFGELADRRLGLAGHAAFETYSVLTRLPGAARRAPAAVERLLDANFPHTVFLGPGPAAALFTHLAQHGLGGGSVYDALVGAAAVEHGLTLVTRDRRALPTYRHLGVDLEVVG